MPESASPDDHHRARGRAGRARQRDRPAARSSSSTACGCSRAAGTAGRRCSRRPATPRSRPAGPTTPRPSRRPTRTPRCSPARPSARSPTTSSEIIGRLDRKPVVIGHSFGGLLTQILAGRGLAAASVAIDPAPFRGVLPLPISALKSAFAGARATRPTATAPCRSPTTSSATRFANAVSEDEAKALYEHVRRAGPGRAAVPGRDREPQPVDRGQGRHQEPRARPAADHLRREGPHRAVGDRQRLVQAAASDNDGVTEIVEIKGRGHALTIDSGWREVADTALDFVQRFTKETA